FPLLTDFFFDHFPLYNKFRAVTFILVLPQMCFPVLGVLALRELTRSNASPELMKKNLLNAGYVTGGLLVLFIVAGGMFYDFTGAVDQQLKGWPDWLMEALKEDRQYIMRMDALRSLFFVAASFVVLWLFLNRKLKLEQTIIVVGLLLLIDLWMVDKRYLNDK